MMYDVLFRKAVIHIIELSFIFNIFKFIHHQIHNSMNFIIRLLITAAIAYILSKILSGVHIDDYITAIIFAFVLALLNGFIKPLLILFTLPITIITLGLFLFVINALIIIIADKFIDGIQVDGFFWALLFSLILSIFTSATNAAMKDGKSD
jgi:putative membrane protein